MVLRDRPTLTCSILAITTSLFLASACSGDDVAPRSAGDAVYQSNCASCHGADQRGTDQGPSQLSIVYEPNHHSDDAYRSAIRNGARQHHWNFGNMPAVEGITDEEIELVIQFIREQQEILGFEY